jgi:hypothetical protein
MTFEETLRGYLLEEALAWLLRHTGYRLLVHESQDRAELRQGVNGLRVRGRGADHQVDVLGEFVFPPAFSLPIRLFLEAKFTRLRTDLKTIRNAHGVIDDINENFARGPNARFMKRYRYVYALFSASGFSKDAEGYALAQQISLIDLSIPAFDWLRDVVETTARQLCPLKADYDVRIFPVNWMRGQLRLRLGTLPDPIPDGFSLSETNAREFRRAAETLLERFAEQVKGDISRELLLGFPSAPFILPMVSQDIDAFLTFARKHPSHAVALRRTRSGSKFEWQAMPVPSLEVPLEDAPIRGSEYQLTFSLPKRFEAWIDEYPDRRDRRTLVKARKFLPNIAIYRMASGSDVLEIFQLRYEPEDVH